VGREKARAAEPDLLQAARELDARRLRMLTRHLRYVVDPDGGLAEANQQHEARYLHLSQTMDGIWYLSARFGPEDGAVANAALQGMLGPPAKDDRRTPAQRRCDAFVEICRRTLDRGEVRQSGGRRPHLMLTADLATLQGQPGSRAAELDWGQPIPRETLERLSCDAAITPVLVDGQGDPLSVGRTTRVISAPLRRALEIRDKGCRWPSPRRCGEQVSWTDGHHFVPWLSGGETTLSNTVLICRRHHRMVHEGRWRLEWNADGTLRAIPPPGQARGRDP
jgi:hypothetical protein